MATWNVNPTSGNDTTGNGTTLPWQTLQKANDMASSGDVVVIKSGTHTLTAAKTTQITKSLTILGETGLSKDVVISGGVAGYCYNVQMRASAIAVEINGITFKDMSTSLGGDPLLGGYEFSATNNWTLTVKNCRFKDCGPSWTDAVFGGKNGDGRTFNIVKNLISHSGSPFSVITVRESTNCNFNFVGNILVCPSLTTLCYYKNPFNFSLQNNHIEFSGNFVYSEGGTPIYTFNNNNTQGSITGLPSGANNLSVDPKFVDPDNLNFHIGRGSPLFNAGVFVS